MKSVLILMCITGITLTTFAQRSYEEAIMQGDSAFVKGQYEVALDKYFAAQAFDQDKKAEVKAKISKMFDEIRNLRAEALKQKKKAEQQAAIAIKQQTRADSMAKVVNKSLDSLRFVLRELERKNKDIEKINNELTKNKIEKEIRRTIKAGDKNLEKGLYKNAKEAYEYAIDLVQSLPLPVEGLAFSKSLWIKYAAADRTMRTITQQEKLRKKSDSLITAFKYIPAYLTYLKADSLKKTIEQKTKYYNLVESFLNRIDFIAEKNTSHNQIKRTSSFAFLKANLYHISNKSHLRNEYLGIALLDDHNLSISGPEWKPNESYQPVVYNILKEIRKSRSKNIIHIKYGKAHSFGKPKLFRDGEELTVQSPVETTKNNLANLWSVSYERLWHPRWTTGVNYSSKSAERERFQFDIQKGESISTFSPRLVNSSNYLSFFIGHHFSKKRLDSPLHLYVNAGGGIRFSKVDYNFNITYTDEEPDVGQQRSLFILEEEGTQRYSNRELYFESTLRLSSIIPRRGIFLRLFAELGIMFAPTLGTDVSAYSNLNFDRASIFSEVRRSEEEYVRIAGPPSSVTNTPDAVSGTYTFEKSDITLFLNVGISGNF